MLLPFDCSFPQLATGLAGMMVCLCCTCYLFGFVVVLGVCLAWMFLTDAVGEDLLLIVFVGRCSVRVFDFLGLCECSTSVVLVWLDLLSICFCWLYWWCVLPADALVVFLVVFVCVGNTMLCVAFYKCLVFSCLVLLIVGIIICFGSVIPLVIW